MIALFVDASLTGFALALVNTQSKKFLWKHFHSSNSGSSRLIAKAVKDGLIESNISLNQISSIAVGAGPGSFTGIRVGLSFAFGISTGLCGIRWRGYSTLNEAAQWRQKHIILRSTSDYGYGARPHNNHTMDTSEVIQINSFRFSDVQNNMQNIELCGPWKELENRGKCTFNVVSSQQIIESAWDHLLESWELELLNDIVPQPRYLRPASVEEKQEPIHHG